jgi:hypothetical protein
VRLSTLSPEEGTRQRFRNVFLFSFSKISRPAKGPNRPSVRWVLGVLSLEVNRPGRDGMLSSSAQIEIFFNATTCPYTLRGTPSWLWPKCNRLLILGRHRTQLRWPDGVSDDMYERGVSGGALNINSTGYPDHSRYGDLPLQIPTAEPVIESVTSRLVVRSSGHQATRLVRLRMCGAMSVRPLYAPIASTGIHLSNGQNLKNE